MRHSGKNGTVKLASGAVTALTGWDIEETANKVALTAAGDAWASYDGTFNEWKGTIKVNLDHEDANQGIRAGDTIAFEGYTEGDATGKTYYSGSIFIDSVSVDAPFDGAVTRSYGFTGAGALTRATVTV